MVDRKYIGMRRNTIFLPTRPISLFFASPTNIANGNPDPPTPADRVVSVNGWPLGRLIDVLPCGLVLHGFVCVSAEPV